MYFKKDKAAYWKNYVSKIKRTLLHPLFGTKFVKSKANIFHSLYHHLSPQLKVKVGSVFFVVKEQREIVPRGSVLSVGLK